MWCDVYKALNVTFRIRMMIKYIFFFSFDSLDYSLDSFSSKAFQC